MMTERVNSSKVVPQLPNWFQNIAEPDSNGQFIHGQISRILADIAVNHLELQETIIQTTVAAAMLAGVVLEHDTPMPKMSMDNLGIGHGIISALAEHNSDLIQATQVLRAANHYLHALLIDDAADPCPF